jgi:integrase
MTKIIRACNSPAEGPRPGEALPHTRVHDLRHIHATALLLNGVPPHVVAARLGHSDIRVTDGYVETASPQARRAARAIGRALFGDGR